MGTLLLWHQCAHPFSNLALFILPLLPLRVPGDVSLRWHFDKNRQTTENSCRPADSRGSHKANNNSFTLNCLCQYLCLCDISVCVTVPIIVTENAKFHSPGVTK